MHPESLVPNQNLLNVEVLPNQPLRTASNQLWSSFLLRTSESSSRLLDIVDIVHQVVALAFACTDPFAVQLQLPLCIRVVYTQSFVCTCC